MRNTTSLLLLFVMQIGFAQSKHENETKFAVSATEIRQDAIDSSIIDVVTVPLVSGGNPSEVFSDDTGCTHENAIASKEFADLLSELNRNAHDESRLQYAFRFARKTCLNASQITQICKAFQSEATRLTFAKYAFSACVDPKNYSKVHDVFVHKSSITDLTMYITGS